MTEEMYLKMLTIALGIITGGASLVGTMLAFYLKGLKAEIVEVKKIQDNVGQQHIQITTNYLTRFANMETKMGSLESKMIGHFEELRGVLNDHFQTRHAEVVETIADLQAQITENVRRSNDNSTEFFKKYAPVLSWAEGQYENHNRRGKNVHKKSSSD